MNTYKVTYYNAQRKAENSVTVKARSLESAIAEENKAIAMMQQFNPFISLKSVEQVTA